MSHDDDDHDHDDHHTCMHPMHASREAISNTLGMYDDDEEHHHAASGAGSNVVSSFRQFLEVLPPLLIISIKRSVYDLQQLGVTKETKSIHFNDKLKFDERWMIRGNDQQQQQLPDYRLKGVILHHGKAAAEGHFSALVTKSSNINSSSRSGSPSSTSSIGDGERQMKW